MATEKKIVSKTKTSKGSSSGATQSAALRKAVKKAEAPAVLEALQFSMEGKKTGVVSLPAEIFGAPWRPDLVHQVTTAIEANKRQNRAHTKDRAEVSGGGKKPWKQKGTGQARHGSSRSPIWRHGGVTFGPRSSRDYSEKINKKMRVQALLSALSRKASDGELIFVDKLAFETPKTAAAKTFIGKLAKGADQAQLSTKRKNAALFALSSYEGNVVKSFRNMGNVATEEVRNLNPLDVLTYKYLVIENPDVALKTLASRVSSKARSIESGQARSATSAQAPSAAASGQDKK